MLAAYIVYQSQYLDFGHVHTCYPWRLCAEIASASEALAQVREAIAVAQELVPPLHALNQVSLTCQHGNVSKLTFLFLSVWQGSYVLAPVMHSLDAVCLPLLFSCCNDTHK